MELYAPEISILRLRGTGKNTWLKSRFSKSFCLDLLESELFNEGIDLGNYLDLGYQLHYWRTSNQTEVDFVLYGEKGIVAIEVKRSRQIGPKHLRGLKTFLKDYPTAKAIVLYGGSRVQQIGGVRLIPIVDFLKNMSEYL